MTHDGSATPHGPGTGAADGHDGHGDDAGGGWEFTESFWDERYGGSEQIWSGDPNQRLVEQAADLEPGEALEIGAGEGADAIWLARRGWRVTALDISRVALDRAAAHAARVAPEAADRITWQQADLLEWEPPVGAYDLVSAHFMHLPREPLATLHRQLAAAVRAGGTLLVVGHHPLDLELDVSGGHRHADASMMPTPEAVAATLAADRWEVVVAQAQPREVAWPGSGEIVTRHDSVMRARRR